MQIKDLIVGTTSEITLVVKSATARETKAKKPYLALEFFDGLDTIQANYWDWTSGKIPEPNTILDVLADVTEWQGNKQLKVVTMKICTTKTIADFMPKSDFDVRETFDKARVMIANITDETLRTVCGYIFDELEDKWLTIPGAKSVHHAFVGGTLVHSYHVAIIAKAISEHMFGSNTDLVVAGALLHDVGKLFTYKMDGINIDTTDAGRLLDHIFIGAEFVGNFAESHVDMDDPIVHAKMHLLRHIILAHHGSLEFGSPVTPQCIEAYIVHHADALDATNEQIRVATDKATSNWTDRIWTLDNRPHVTHTAVAELMGK